MVCECSECGGRVIADLPSEYMYKYRQGSTTVYQCSYTCYDHACLRFGRRKYISEKNFIRYVDRFEESMISQGKKILHPIKKYE